MSRRCSCRSSGPATSSSWTTSRATRGRHKGPKVRTLIEAAGAKLLFLPPYNPDFNPIENAFAKFKALLRKAAERTVAGLWRTIGCIVDTFSPTECANDFAAAGYDAD